MSPRLQAACLIVVTAALTAEHRLAATPPSRESHAAAIAVAPAFIENRGQADPRARFFSVGGGRPIFFTTNDVRIADPARQRSLWMTFVNGGAREIDGEWTTGGRVTVLRRATASDSPMFRDVVYRAVWPGIDARVSAASKGLKYSFEVAPGANPREIHLRYSGHDRITLTDSGELNLEVGGTTITDTRPVAYQHIGGRMVQVPVRFVQFESDVAFSVGAYDRTQPLVIDPTLVYSTYLGGSGDDEARAIAVDGSGAAYIAGAARYGDFPVTSGVYQPNFRGGNTNPGSDAFVAKINPAGTRFDYVTFLGGSANDDAYGIAVDAGGNAYVTGWTESSDFPTTQGAFKRTYPGNRDGFLTKLNSTGTGLVYSTYFGGVGTTTATAVTVDHNGYAYVVGQTVAENLPHSPGAGSRGASTPADGFLLKFSADGSQVPFGANIGGGGLDMATAVAVDANGHALVTGWTLSTYGFSLKARDTGNVGVQQFPTGPSYVSTDNGNTFNTTGTWWTTASSRAFAIDPSHTSTAYEITSDLGLMKTTDGGATWTPLECACPLNGAGQVFDITINPANTSMLLTATSNGLLQSTDGGLNWHTVLGATNVRQARYSTAQTSTAYAITASAVFRSTDGGSTWTATGAPANFLYYDIAIDPATATTVYIASSNGLLKSTNGGTSWTTTPLPSSTVFTDVINIAIDPTLTSVLWAGMATGEVFRSTNSGAAWSAVPSAQVAYPSEMVFDGGTLYISDNGHINSSAGFVGSIAKTTDRGATWQHLKVRGNLIPLRTVAAVGGVVYAGGDLKSEAFLVKLDTNGTTQPWLFQTYLGGGLDDYGVGVAYDRNGNPVVAVETHSADYPASNPGNFRQSAVSRLNADGSQLTVSTFVGPTSGIARAMSIDGNDNAYVTGVQGTSPSHGVFVDQVNDAGADVATFALAGVQSNVAAPDSVPAGIASGPTAGDVFVAGITNTVDFPSTATAPQRSYGSGRSDAFAAKIAFGGETPPPPPPPSSNLALFKPVTSSSDFDHNYTAVNAVDDSLATRWSSQFSDPQWIYVDLQGTYDISEVLLRWEAAYGADYQVQVSNDAANWTTIRTVTGGDGAVDDLTGLSGTGRYVRINGIHRGTQYGYSLWEFEVYGTAASPPPPPPPGGNIALNRPVVSSSDFSSSYAAPLAVDGGGSTRWSSQFSDPQWIYVDLGARYDVTGVKLSWETAYGADFQIQASDDAQTWTTLATITGNTQLTNEVGVSGTGRYVRMNGLRRGTQWGYSLWEFEVYGHLPNTTDWALHRPVVSSSDFSPAYAAQFAVDGDPSTRWSSQFSESQWIYVDFGQRISVNEVVLSWETAYGRYYQLQVSDDLENWTTIGQVIDGDGGIDDVTGLSGTGRYLRLVGITRATEWGFSLWSLQAFGEPAP